MDFIKCQCYFKANFLGFQFSLFFLKLFSDPVPFSNASYQHSKLFPDNFIYK